MKKLLVMLCLAAIWVVPVSATASVPHDPIVIIPGLGASFNWDVMLEPSPAPAQIARAQDSWKYAPTVNQYDNLAQALTDIGLAEGEDFFIAYYDWRQSNADSAANYLIPVIDTALARSETGKVDIIAHSMGGLIARSYIQSNAYRNDVDQMILLGTPNHGSSDAYALWQAGDVPSNWKKSERHMLAFYIWYMTQVTGLTGDAYDTIHTFIPSIQEVLPTYDHVANKETEEMVGANAMRERNLFLSVLNLSENVKKLRPRVPGKVFTMVGTGEPTLATIPTVPHSGADGKLWVDGKPEPYPSERESLQGDGRVTVSSALLDDFSPIFSETPSLLERIARAAIPTAEAFGFFFDQTIITSAHDALPTTALNNIFAILALGAPVKTYALPDEPQELLAFWIASPVDIVIRDPQGRTISSSTNAIPGGTFEGAPDPKGVKMVSIENPIRGTYIADLLGVDSGAYHFASAYFAPSDEDVQTIEDSIALHEHVRYAVTLAPERPSAVEITPQDAPKEALPDPLSLLSSLMADIVKARDEGKIPSAFAKRLMAPLQSAQGTFVKISELPNNGSKTRNEQTLLRFSVFQVNLYLALLKQSSPEQVPADISGVLADRGQHIVQLLTRALTVPPPASPFI